VAEVPIAIMLKRQGGTNWLFTVNMRNQPTSGTFTISGLPENASAEVLGESRRIVSSGREFADDFKPYDVHLYRVGGR
jgi:hypothetical protein